VGFPVCADLFPESADLVVVGPDRRTANITGLAAVPEATDTMAKYLRLRQKSLPPQSAIERYDPHKTYPISPEPGECRVLNTAAWPEVELQVLTGIQLDPKNVRLETSSIQVEADIIEDLFVNENVLELVEGISKVGYLTHETPIVIKRRGSYVVVEGNRRVAALKSIQNPMIIPDYSARVAAFAKTIPNIESLAAIRVMVAPNQELANQLIAAIHTGNLRRPWTPARQAAFFQAQIDAGRKYKDLKQRYPTIDVRRFVFRAHMVSMFRHTKYDDPELNDFIKTKDWGRSLSTLARIYESREFLAITGFALGKDGALTKDISDEVQKKIAALIVEGIQAGDLHTRSLATVSSPRFTRLMSDVRSIASESAAPTPPSGKSPIPPPPAGGSSTPAPPSAAASGPASDGSVAATGKGASNAPQPASKQSGAKKTKVRFVPVGQLVAPAQYPIAIRLHLEELSTLDIQKFPNTTFIMLRALIEKSIKAYAEAKNIDIKGTGNNTNGYVQLHHALKWLGEYVQQHGPKPLIQPITQLRSGRLVNYTASSDALNAINHNHHFHVEPDEVLNCWNSIDSIMRELMKP
jgi:hypothetical protein